MLKSHGLILFMEKKKTRWVLGVDEFPENKVAYYLGLKKKYSERRITMDIAKDYCKKAEGKTLQEIIVLRNELEREYGVTELEATNILNGYHISDYVKKYEDYSNGIFYNVTGRNSHRA